VVALVVLLGLNAVVTDNETKPAEVTVAGGRILKLPVGVAQRVGERAGLARLSVTRRVALSGRGEPW
jgi:hypothetical protein